MNWQMLAYAVLGLGVSFAIGWEFSHRWTVRKILRERVAPGHVLQGAGINVEAIRKRFAPWPVWAGLGCIILGLLYAAATSAQS